MVGIIIVAFNDEREFERLLVSVKNQSYEEYNLYIVDNSSEFTAKKNYKVLSDLFSEDKYNYLKTDKNYGSAKGFYLGMKEAHNDNSLWVWLLDQDMELEEKALERMIEFGVKNNINVLTSRTYSIEEKSQFAALTEKNIFGRGKRVEYSNRNFLCPTHGFLIHRSILDRIGYYDYLNFFVGLEDFDYCNRVYKINEKIGFVGDAIVYHPSPRHNNKTEKQSKEKLFLKRILEALFPFLPASFITLRDRKNLDSREILYYNKAYSKAYLISKYNNFISVVYALIYFSIKITIQKIRRPKEVKYFLSFEKAIKGIKSGMRDRNKLKFF